MTTVSTIVSIVLGLALLGSAGAVQAKVPQSTKSIAAVGWPPERNWLLVVLKGLGGLGLLVGIAVPLIGILAAGGVVLYFVGALVLHIQAKAYDVAPAAGFLVLAVVALVTRSISA